MKSTENKLATPVRRHSSLESRDKSHLVLAGGAYIFVSVFALVCILPLMMVVSASFSKESLILKHGYSIFPRGFTLVAYEALFTKANQFIGSFLVTVGMVIFGAGGGLFLTAMTGYCLQRQDFKYRNAISFYIYFTTLFGGGMVAFYLLIVRYLNWNNSYLSVIVPGMLGAWNIFMMKNFMKGIPYEITEAAKIDGAGDFSIFIRIILPLSLPSLATVGLFLTIHYWNEWYSAMLYLSPTKVKYLPVQLFLYNALNQANFIRSAAANIDMSAIDTANLPSETMKMSIAVVSTIPIILVYPFIQRFFISGIVIGGVKG